MRFRILLILTLILGMVGLLRAAPVAAVQYGQPDGDGHPYVGLVVFYDEHIDEVWIKEPPASEPRPCGGSRPGRRAPGGG